MEYLIGALFAVLLFTTFIAGYYLGSRQKPKPREPDEEQVRKAKQLRSGFEQLMSYDVSKATGKKVN